MRIGETLDLKVLSLLQKKSCLAKMLTAGGHEGMRIEIKLCCLSSSTLYRLTAYLKLVINNQNKFDSQT